MAFQIDTINSFATISVANTSLDGTGAINAVVTAGGAYGTVITTIRIQSITDVPIDMVRLFLKSSAGTYSLIKEIPVPATEKTDQYPCFATTIAANIFVQNGGILGASTDQGTTYIITAIGYDITGFI